VSDLLEFSDFDGIYSFKDLEETFLIEHLVHKIKNPPRLSKGKHFINSPEQETNPLKQHK